MNKVLPKKQCASEKNVPFHEILQSLTEHFSWRPFVKSSSILNLNHKKKNNLFITELRKLAKCFSLLSQVFQVPLE